MCKRALHFVYVLLVLALPLTAEDLTGKWTAAMSGRDGNTRSTTFQLKAQGDKLTGAVSTTQGESQIKDGKISGDEVSFITVQKIDGNEFKVNYVGKVAGKEILFRRVVEERAPAPSSKRPAPPDPSGHLPQPVEFVAKKVDSGNEGGRPKAK
jgi:hypothetical protein